MEKAVVLLPIILFFGLFALLVVGFLGLVTKLLFKARNDSYKGKVVNKIYNSREDTDGDTLQYFTLELDCENGRKVKIPVTASEYKSAQKGDIYEKIKGQLKPHKII